MISRMHTYHNSISKYCAMELRWSSQKGSMSGSCKKHSDMQITSRNQFRAPMSPETTLHVPYDPYSLLIPSRIYPYLSQSLNSPSIPLNHPYSNPPYNPPLRSLDCSTYDLKIPKEELDLRQLPRPRTCRDRRRRRMTPDMRRPRNRWRVRFYGLLDLGGRDSI